MGKKKKNKDLWFRKDEEGQDVFYPWGCPGEAFYVNQRPFNRILIFLNIFSILFVVYVCGAVFADLQNMISQNTWNQLFSSVFIFFPALYICGMHLFSKGASVYVAPKESRPPKKGMVLLLFIIICSQMPGIVSTLVNHSITFTVLSTAYIVFISYFLMKIRRSRGYYFSGKD